ncbi:MAG TPA: potassium channel family protein [Acidimicrobiales bacterium]|nr:potassium channel family protein [Acidimicrobiales bacterium]
MEKRPSSIERIQRLERLERERLEEKERKEERRRRAVAGAKPSGGRHDLVDRIEQAMKYPMAVLGTAWLVVAIVVLTGDIGGSAPIALVGTLFVLWALLLLEYLVRLAVTPDRRAYLKRRWVEPATVVVPPLQSLHLVGIEKMTLIVYEAELRVEAILKHHGLFRVLIATGATLFLGAWLVLLLERNAKGSNIHDYADALWWAIVTVTTVGYGDRYPVSAGGRAVAVVLMLVGIGLIGVLTATVASVFIKEHSDASKDAFQKGHADLGQQLSVISDRLADVERRLGATPEEVAVIDPPAEPRPQPNGPIEPAQGASTSRDRPGEKIVPNERDPHSGRPSHRSHPTGD